MTVRRMFDDDRGGARPLLPGLAAVATIALLGACSPPGSDAGGGETEADPSEVSTDIGVEEIELTLYDGAGLKTIDDALIAAFEKEHPNVSISTRFDPDDVQAQNAPRVLASDDPPDIARINALADIVSNGQLTNLDPGPRPTAGTNCPRGSWRCTG